jgi:hypothetical protein
LCRRLDYGKVAVSEIQIRNDMGLMHAGNVYRTAESEEEAMKTLAFNPRCVTGRRMVFALLLVSIFADQSLGARAAHAGSIAASADVTFTGWETTLSTDSSTSAGVKIAGVVWGDVGRGRYHGEILDGHDTFSQPHLWVGYARYEFHGVAHSFTARVRITEIETSTPITATIQGVVTDGWLKGARVTGTYKYWTFCPMPTSGNKAGHTCHQGDLHLSSSPATGA